MNLQLSKGISVIICCYNSEARIGDTLRYLASQKVSPFLKWEVILVDNNCTDNTVAIAEQSWKDFADIAPLHVIKAPQPGLNNARKKGVESAAYSYFLYCDDDNWLEENYVADAFAIGEANRNFGVWGASVIDPVYQTANPPEWVKDFQYLFTCHHYNATLISSIKDSNRVIPVGAGQTSRTEIGLQYFKLFEKDKYRASLDRTKDSLMSSGDLDYVWYVYSVNLEAAVCENLKMKHFIPETRAKKNYLKRISYSMSYSNLLVNYMNGVSIQALTLNFKGFVVCVLFKLFNGWFPFMIAWNNYKGSIDAIKFIRENLKGKETNLNHDRSILNING